MAEYSDLDFAFSPNPITKDVKKVQGVDSVKASIKNIIRTNTFERLFQPGLGCDLKQFLFEPISNLTSQRMVRNIEASITALEPRAQNFQVVVEPRPNDNEYRVEIKFFVIEQLEPVFFETFLSRVR